MNKLSPDIGNQQSSSPTQVNQFGRQEERKILIFKLNPKIKQIFQNIDFDYSDLFIELAIFPIQQKETNILDKEKKKNFFVKNYERILIHFFQFLFDFELQTLHFTEKYETIPSFGEWLESQVSFQLSDQINLLHKKKSQLKKDTLIEVQEKTDTQKNSLSPKRYWDTVEQNSIKILTSSIESPKKMKVTDDGASFVDFCSKYDEVTNHTAHYTPNHNSKERDIIQQKNQAHMTLIKQQKNQAKSKRKILKVKYTQKSKNQSLQSIQKNPKKQPYTLKQNFKQKRESRRISSIEKQKVIKNLKGKPVQKLPIIEEKVSKEFEKEPQIIVLQSSGEVTQKQQIKKNEISIISISECSIVEEVSALNQVGKSQNTKQKNPFQKQIKVQSGEKLIQLQSDSGNVTSLSKISQTQMGKKLNKQQESKSYNFQKLKDIVQDIRISYHLQNDKNPKDYQQIYREKQQRKLHNFRSRLSGVFRYPQKRFYIFPEMTEGYDKKQDNNTFNRRSFDVKSMSKSKSLKKQNSKDKNKKE